MVYESESNIFVSIQVKIVLTWRIKSRWNTTLSVMKNSARSTTMSYMLYIFGFALWRIWMHHGSRFIHYDSPDGRTLRARNTFTVLWRLLTPTYFSIVTNYVMVKRWKLLLKIKSIERDKLFGRKWKFQNYRKYVRSLGYKMPTFTVDIYNSPLLSEEWCKERRIAPDQPRTPAIAEGPHDSSCQLKFVRQLPRNSAEEITCTTSSEQIEVMKLNRYSKAMCNKHVHSTMTRWSRIRCPVGVINKPTTFELWISPVGPIPTTCCGEIF